MPSNPSKSPILSFREGCMRRREFITLIGGATATWPLATLAQKPTMPIVSNLQFGQTQGALEGEGKAGLVGLKQTGFENGRNVIVDAVQRTGDTFLVIWIVTGSRQVGIGIGKDDFLAVSYRSGNAIGIAVYRPDGDGWSGIWAPAGTELRFGADVAQIGRVGFCGIAPIKTPTASTWPADDAGNMRGAQAGAYCLNDIRG
jgi:hypothetical protein